MRMEIQPLRCEAGILLPVLRAPQELSAVQRISFVQYRP